jgi:signal transduction histidine kinase
MTLRGPADAEPLFMLTLPIWMAVLLGAAMALWLAAAAWAVWTGLSARKKAQFSASQADRLALLLESAPALPLMVKSDGRIEAPARLADWIGLTRLPNFLTDLSASDGGLKPEDLTALTRDVSAAQKTGRSFTRALQVQGSPRTLLIKGAPATSRLAASGAVILWWFDATESQDEIGRLGEETARLKLAFSRLSALIEAAPIPMWFRSPDLTLAMVNHAYVAAVEGTSAEDVIAQRSELVDGAGTDGPLASANTAVQTKAPVRRIAPVTVAGERRSFEIVDVPLDDIGVAGYALDVEEVDRANAAFQRYAQSQRDMLDKLSSAVAQFGPDRTLLFCNQPFRSLFAIRPEWLAERPNFDRILDRMREAGRLPETRDFPAWRAERRDWFRASGDPIEDQWLLPGGKHLRVVAQPIPDGGLVLIFEDQTEQVQLASARDTLLRVQTATFDSLFEAVGVFEGNGRLSNWNSRFVSNWEQDEEFFASHPHVDALADKVTPLLADAERAKVIRDLVRSATLDRKQRSGRIALASGRFYELAAVPLPDGNALLTMLDITDSRNIESALRERADALEQADKVKTNFLANMSYELRTPLTSIAGYAEMLEAGMAGPLSDQAQDYAKSILEASGRLGGMIDRVLDLTQGTSGGLPMEQKNVELAMLAHDAVRLHKPAAEAKGLEFVAHVEPMVGAIRGDARRLAQVLDHLIDNAIAYTPPGGRILLHADGDVAGARIVVSDNGPGMDAAAQARAFDSFSRAANARDGSTALGLGLPVARQLVEAHGGTLTLLSEVGEGTAISIELPR